MQEHSETQLDTQGPRNFKAKALGFTRSLVDVASLEKVVFFSDFRLSVVCVQPNLQYYNLKPSTQTR